MKFLPILIREHALFDFFVAFELRRIVLVQKSKIISQLIKSKTYKFFFFYLLFFTNNTNYTLSISGVLVDNFLGIRLQEHPPKKICFIYFLQI